MVNIPLHPPLAVVEARKAAHAVFSSACVPHAGIVTSCPQLNITFDGGETVNVAEQVWS